MSDPSKGAGLGGILKARAKSITSTTREIFFPEFEENEASEEGETDEPIVAYFKPLTSKESEKIAELASQAVKNKKMKPDSAIVCYTIATKLLDADGKKVFSSGEASEIFEVFPTGVIQRVYNEITETRGIVSAGKT